MSENSEASIVRNPKTGRFIKVGSRAWLNLVKEGLIDNTYEDPKELGDIEDDDENSVENQIEEINQKLPFTQQAVRGRGKYKGKIVARSKQPTQQTVARKTAKTTGKLIKKIDPNLEVDSTDFENELEKLIFEELMIGTPVKKTKSGKFPAPIQRAKAVPIPQRKNYYIQEESEESEAAEESDEEEEREAEESEEQDQEEEQEQEEQEEAQESEVEEEY